MSSSLDAFTDYELIDELSDRGIDTLADAPVYDIIKEMDYRGYECIESRANPASVDLEDLYEARRTGNPAFDALFSSYCWTTLGRIL